MFSKDNTQPAPEREVVTGSVPDRSAAEEAVARLAGLAEAGAVDVVVKTIEDDPSTEEEESGIAVRAEVPASQAEAARAALRLPGDQRGVSGGEGGI